MTESTTFDFDTETEIIQPFKKPAKEVPVIQDQGFFQHKTGDTYDGYFEAKKKERSVKMQGPGVYTTAEGDRYVGTWEADKLTSKDEVVITFADSSRYEGLLKDWCYSGTGNYYYPDGSMLNTEFAENCPKGHMTLTDPNGHTWIGNAERGYGWFEPLNHFYDLLEKTRDTGRIKRRHKEKDTYETDMVKNK